MKSKNLIIGLLVLFFGVVTLLSTLNVFDFHWSIVWRLWPMILVIFGITLLPLNDYIKGALVLAALGVGCLLYNVEAKHYQGNTITRFYNNIKSWDIYGDEDEKEDDDDDSYAVDQHFSEPFTDIEHASINIDFGAGDLTLKDPCAELAKVDAQSNFVKYSFRTETGDDKPPSLSVEEVTPSVSASETRTTSRLRSVPCPSGISALTWVPPTPISTSLLIKSHPSISMAVLATST